MTNSLTAMKLALDALEWGSIDADADRALKREAIAALRQAISEAEQAEQPEGKCNAHPDAPHGFCRDESITQDRYVCECEFWEPPKAEQEPVVEVIKSNIFNALGMK